MRLKITGGRVYDPVQDWLGEVRDLYVDQGRLVAPLAAVDRVIEAEAKLVVPAGIDIRAQVATYGLDFLRLDGTIPSPRELGEAYAGLGYTHIHEPFLTPQTAGYVHRQLSAIPVVDASASLVVNLRDLDLWLTSPERQNEIAAALLFLLEQTKSLNLRLTEPYVRYRQDFYAHRRIDLHLVLPVLAALAESANLTFTLEASPELLAGPLPSPISFHLAALGPALESDETLAAALAHLEAGASGDMGLLLGGAQMRSPGFSRRIDLGWHQPLELNFPNDPAAGRRALNLALAYRGPNLAFSQAGPGKDPAADHPRGASWLADVDIRRREWGEGLEARRYTLSDWLWATRTLPARLLGLADRGHFCLGARADIAIFDLPTEDAGNPGPQHLGRCRLLLKAGEIVVEDFSLVSPQVPRTTYFRRTEAPATSLVHEISRFYHLRGENIWVPEKLAGSWVAI